MAISAAFSIWAGEPPRMAAQTRRRPSHTPTRLHPWHPSSAPEIDALRLITVPITPAVNRTPGRLVSSRRRTARNRLSVPRLPAEAKDALADFIGGTNVVGELSVQVRLDRTGTTSPHRRRAACSSRRRSTSEGE